MYVYLKWQVVYVGKNTHFDFKLRLRCFPFHVMLTCFAKGENVRNIGCSETTNGFSGRQINA